MICTNCGEKMQELGCQVSGGAVHWCMTCGSLKLCDTESMVVPIWSREPVVRDIYSDEELTVKDIHF